ncbi:hypothetical protein KC363_g144 [Hortaea werneckii]|nr:hypothetical protein KC363_g144 [Hortaea werneckii]
MCLETETETLLSSSLLITVILIKSNRDRILLTHTRICHLSGNLGVLALILAPSLTKVFSMSRTVVISFSAVLEALTLLFDFKTNRRSMIIPTRATCNAGWTELNGRKIQLTYCVDLTPPFIARRYHRSSTFDLILDGLFPLVKILSLQAAGDLDF